MILGSGFITTNVDKGNLNGSLLPSLKSIQPIADQTVCAGEQISLSVSATGIGNLSYQWQKGGSDLLDGGSITGSTSANLVINTSLVSDSGNYTCIVTDNDGPTTSNPATVTVNALPIVATNIPDTNVCYGESVTLAGSGASSYLWDNAISNNVSFNATVTTTYTVTGD
jgi:hypothetical protein